MQETKLNDFFPEWATGKGIFHFLDNAGDMPWKDVLSENTLSFDYHGNNSGTKFPSPVVLYVMEEGQTDTKRGYLANVIVTRFLKKWTKLWNTFSLQYNPIENYSMTEENTGTENRDIWSKGESESTLQNNINGFNSTDSVPSSDNTEGVNSSTHSNETLSYNNRKMTRSGNIGVTTSQQMIQSERELWMYDFFKETVYKDIDRVLTLNIY